MTSRLRAALPLLPALLLVGALLRPLRGAWNDAVLATGDGADAVMQSGILTWSARHFWRPETWLDLPIFHPARSALVFMDSLLGQALLIAPWQALGDPHPAALYNLACLLTLLLAGGAAALLWRATGGGAAGAGFCALALLASPYTTWQLGLLNQLPPPWVPALAATLFAAWRRLPWADQEAGRGEGRGAIAPAAAGARGPLWAAGGCLAVQAAWGWYGFASSLFLAAVIGGAVVWHALRRRRGLRLLALAAPPLLASAAAVLLLAAPYLRLHASESSYTRTPSDVRAFSADLHHFLNQGEHRLGWLRDGGKAGSSPASSEPDAARGGEPALHPGWVILACAAWGWARRRRLPPPQARAGSLLLAAALVGLVLAFGDSVSLPPGGERRVPLPFGLLQEALAPLRALRAPVRFSYLLAVALAWWAAAGCADLARLPWRAGRRRLLLAGVWTALWLEAVPARMPTVPLVADGRPTREVPWTGVPAGAVLTLPAPAAERHEDVVEARWLHRALASGRPVTGGVSGWVPPATSGLRRRLLACEEGQESTALLLRQLIAQGVTAAEIAAAGAAQERARFWIGALELRGWEELPAPAGYRRFAPPRPAADGTGADLSR